MKITLGFQQQYSKLCNLHIEFYCEISMASENQMMDIGLVYLSSTTTMICLSMTLLAVIEREETENFPIP